MKRTLGIRIARTNGLAPVMAMICALTLGPEGARGQNYDNPIIAGYENPTAGSLEEEMLNRLSVTGQYRPGDLPRLARLTVLESIAMYENLRSDFRGTSTGARIEGEMSELWDAAELFYVSANYPPPNLGGLNRSRALLADVNAAYRQIDSSLRENAGMASRSALHLEDISRLLPVMNSAFEAIDAEVNTPVVAPVARRPDFAPIREQSRRLTEDIRSLVAGVTDAKPAPVGSAALIPDLNGLLELVRGFDRTLDSGPSTSDLVASLRVLRRRMWAVEARIARTPGIRALQARWRQIRSQIDAMSDDFGLPRVVNLVRASERPGRAQAEAVDRKLVAQVDRSIVALDEYLSQDGAALKQTEAGADFEGQVGRLRLDLLQLRQRSVAKELTGPLSPLFLEIESINRQLRERAKPDSRIIRGDVAFKAPRFLRTAEAVDQLRQLMPDPQAARKATP